MKAEDVPALTPEARLHARSTADAIVLGLLVAEIADLHPGARERIRGRADAVLAAASQGYPPAVTEEITKAVEVLLGVSNT